MAELPFIDTHALVVDAPREAVWAGLLDYVERSLRIDRVGPLATLLGTEPRPGFAVVASEPRERLTLAGRHRFSRYRLVFALEETPGGATRLSAHSYALFPGLHGRLYRLLVIDSRVHVLATRRLLREIGRRVRERG